MDITGFIISQREQAFLGGDHENYRAQCSRRIHTLRRRLGIATPKGRKYTAKPAVSAENISKNVEYTNLLLLDAERSWATAMAMKTARVEDSANQAITGSTKRQIISRLNKASIYSGKLLALLESQETNIENTRQSLLEVQAYHAYLRGCLYFEKGSWEECLKSFAVARVIYEALAGRTKKDMFKDLLSSTIDPSIRYAAYQFRLPRTKPISEVAIDYFPQDKQEIRDFITEIQPEAFDAQNKVSADGQVSSQAAVSSITWGTRKVRIEDAAISEALVAAGSAEAQLPTSFANVDQNQLMAIYDEIINARQEVVDTTKTAIDELLREGVDQSDQRLQGLQVTRTAVNYALIEWRVGRDRILCGKDDGVGADSRQGQQPQRRGTRSKRNMRTGSILASFRKVVALYDTILQSLSTVRDLPGVAGDTNLVSELKGKDAYFRALKCLVIGRSHAILNRLPNALALFSRAQVLSAEAVELIKGPQRGQSSTAPKLEVSKDQLTSLNIYLKNLVLQYRGLAELQRLSSKQDPDSQKARSTAPPIAMNLDHYPEYDVDLANLVNYPPKIEPIPVKPLFFDLAWNYIDYPGRAPNLSNGVEADQTVGSKAEEKKETKRGWFGFGR